jgi:arginine utilization regulatory protein
LDVLLLADLALEACSNGTSVRARFTDGVRELLLHERWHGNVRELIALVSCAFRACRGRPELDLDAVSAAPRVDRWLPRNGKGPQDASRDGPDGFLTLEQATSRHIREALRRSEGNIAKAARLLDMPRSTLDSRLRQWRSRAE